MTRELQSKIETDGLPVLPFNIWTDTQAVQAGQVHQAAEVVL